MERKMHFLEYIGLAIFFSLAASAGNRFFEAGVDEFSYTMGMVKGLVGLYALRRLSSLFRKLHLVMAKQNKEN